MPVPDKPTVVGCCFKKKEAKDRERIRSCLDLQFFWSVAGDVMFNSPERLPAGEVCFTVGKLSDNKSAVNLKYCISINFIFI